MENDEPHEQLFVAMQPSLVIRRFEFTILLQPNLSASYSLHVN
jgi:hypothetical protein